MSKETKKKFETIRVLLDGLDKEIKLCREILRGTD